MSESKNFVSEYPVDFVSESKDFVLEYPVDFVSDL